jgi:hypothetical protein
MTNEEIQTTSDVNSAVVSIIEGAIVALTGVGLSRESALQLLGVQAACRMSDEREAACLLASINAMWGGTVEEDAATLQ